MCGIAGIVHAESSHPVDPPLLEQMCVAIRHRGPDDMGFWVSGSVGLGMTRLSIIDLTSGHQPIHNEDKSLWIVFNGEIYNYRELRANLITAGHRFYTHTDTEVIIHLYEEYGVDCLHHLRGMFAFAIWDTHNGQLFLARDRLGIKPLHYYHNGKSLCFGSELKSILQYPEAPRQLRPSAIVNYFYFGFVPDPETIFAGIHKLPPGHFLLYRRGEITTQQYWRLDFNKTIQGASEDSCIEELIQILNDSVNAHLISDVPIGAFLSGGIDSGLVVALMAKHMNRPVKTFSIGFAEDKFNELPFARMIARQYGTDHYEEVVSPDSRNVLHDLVRHFDEPFADSSVIPTYYVSQLARRHVKVVLSGDGGDELFGGYSRYVEGDVTRYTRWIPSRMRGGFLRDLALLLPEWSPGTESLRHIACDNTERLIRRFSRHLSSIHNEIFTPEFQRQVETTDPSATLLHHLQGLNSSDNFTRSLCIDTNMNLPGDILTKVDRMSMLHSLEVRVPILDHVLVEWATHIPNHLKLSGNTTKYLFKKACERFLPLETIHRPKQGFVLPIRRWIREDWSDLVHELILSERTLSRGYFERMFLTRILTEHRLHRRDHTTTLWTLMILELWLRETLDRNPQHFILSRTGQEAIGQPVQSKS